MIQVSTSNRVRGAFAFELCYPPSLVFLPWSFSVGVTKTIVASMGMGWDMGPPTWPCRSVQIISYAINLPVYRVLCLILELHYLHMYPSRYALWLSTLVVLWCWVGPTIDFGLWGSRRYSHRELIVAILSGDPVHARLCGTLAPASRVSNPAAQVFNLCPDRLDYFLCGAHRGELGNRWAGRPDSPARLGRVAGGLC